MIQSRWARFSSGAAGLLVAGAIGAAACGGGSVRAEARAGGEVDVFEFDRPLAEAEIAAEDDAKLRAEERESAIEAAQGSIKASGAGDRDQALLGARHDVRLSEVGSPRCQCLAVALGGASQKGISWQGPVPRVDAGSQLVIALGSEGIECGGAAGAVASYRGYELVGSDVVVTVETAKAGRPITHGAIIPRPSGGQVLIQPAGSSVPFGRSLSGDSRCSLGNPASS